MYKHTLKYFFLFFFFSCSILLQAKKEIPVSEKIQQEFNKMQAGFEPNEGQFNDETGKSFVLFRSQGNGVSLFLTKRGISYIFSGEKEGDYVSGQLDIDLKGAKLNKDQTSFSEPVGNARFNYYIGSNANGVLNVMHYKKVRIKNVYPGIDWIWHYSDQGLKYDFVVHPYADPKQIQLEVKGYEKLKLLFEKQVLKIKSKFGEIQEGDLYCYQGNQQVKAKYLKRKNIISYAVENYDPTKDLIIDPPLTWATFFGGGTAGGTSNYAAVDKCGFLYITGQHYEDLPQMDPGGGAYMRNEVITNATTPFIAKFCSTGKLIWSTHYAAPYTTNTAVFTRGGSSYSIAIDDNDNAYIAGWTVEPDFPLFDPGGGAYFQNTGTAGGFDRDGFLVKFDKNGIRLWATGIGGDTGDDEICTVITDNQGNVYIGGRTTSTDYPTLDPGGGAYFQPALNGSVDGVITKFSNTGAMLWSTYIGGSDGGEEIRILEVDPNDNLYATGNTYTSDFPTVNPGGGAYFQAASGGKPDAFISKFDLSGNMIWSTYYGGDGSDDGFAITFESNGNVIVAGGTYSSDFPTQDAGGLAYYDNVMDNVPPFRNDLFILKFDQNNNRLWATLFGADDSEQFDGNLKNHKITCDANDNLFISFLTRSQNMPVLDPGSFYFQGTHAGNLFDAGIVEFDKGGQLLWSTYCGTPNEDKGGHVVTYEECVFVILRSFGVLNIVDPGNNAWSQPPPTNWGMPYIMRFGNCPNDITGNVSKTNLSCGATNDATAKVEMTSTGCEGSFTYSWSNGANTPEITGLTGGKYIVTVKDICENTFIDSVEIPFTSTLQIDSLKEQTICLGTSVLLDPVITGGNPSYTYDWDNGASSDTSFSVSPADTSVYVLKVTDKDGCEGFDTVKINVVPKIIASVNPDLTICAGDSVQLSASGGSTYQWTPAVGLSDPNSPNPMAAPNTTISYQVVVGAGSCPDDIVSVTVEVVPTMIASISPDITLCEGKDTVITAAGGTNYSWNTNDTTASINVSPNTTTTYTVIVSAGSCGEDTAEVTVTVIPVPSANAGADQNIELGQSITINATGLGTYSWNPPTGLSCINCLTPTASPSITTTYILTISDGICADQDTVIVNVENTCGEFYVPNAFSPNGDGVNDEFKIRHNCISTFSILIFDRWGKKVFESTDPNKSWDGEYTGSDGNTAVFDYTLKATLLTGEIKELKGNVSLIR